MASIPTGNENPNAAPWVDMLSRQYLDRVLPESQASILGGLQLRPKNVHFATQNKGEKVYILLRKHWLTNLGWAFNLAVLIAIPIVVYLVAQLFNQDLVALVGAKLITIIVLTYYSILVTYFLRNYINWFFNIYIVTNERVVDYDVNVDVSSTGTSELELERIEEVEQKSVGFLPNLFNYGSVEIFSAADNSSVKFADIPRPTFVRDKISDLAKLVKTIGNES